MGRRRGRPRITDAELGPVVLAFDQLMCDMTPEEAEAIRTATRATMGTAWVDQTTAANDDAVRIAQLSMAGRGGTSHAIHAAALPGWFRLGAHDTYTAWLAGNVRTCVHNPDPDRPAPTFAVAWRPRLVVCIRCPHLIKATRAEDVICDGCGRDTTGHGITPNTVVIGNGMSYTAGACADCNADMEAARVSPLPS